MELRITKDGDERDIAFIHNALREYNLAKREPSENVPLGIFLEDTGEKLAGLTGETFGNWLCLKYLWVREDLRGRGIGKKVLQAAETEAVTRGCKYAFVDTFDFQAPTFYEKMGYSEVFALNEYPFTGSRHYYTKILE